MNKKVLITYSMLFLFAFTFAFAFGLASSANADNPPCCVVEWCPGNPPTPALEGTVQWDPVLRQYRCQFDPKRPDCMAYICDET